MKLSRAEYARQFGPTSGDLLRLGDTDLWVRVEADDVGVVDHEEQALQGECEIVGEVPGGVPGVAPEG